MAITSGYFDSIDHDRLYDAATMSNYFEGLVSDGIYENIGDKFIVQAGSGLTISVGSGRGLIKTRWIKNDASVSFELDAADVQLNRIDAVVLRLDLTESGREITIAVKKGTSAANPTAPAMTRNTDIYELCLAYVRISRGTTSISQSYITDMRASNLCGYVTGLIRQVDTAELFLQWQTAYENYYAESTAAFDAYMAAKRAEFTEWFNSLTTSLNVNTAITKYTNSVTKIGTTSEVSVGIPEYDSSNDVIFVYINGVHMTDGVEYRASGSGDAAKITLANVVSGNNTFTFDVLKNVIGSGVLSAGNAIIESGGTAEANTGISQEVEA